MDAKELETRLLNEKKELDKYMEFVKEELAYRSGRVKMLEELLGIKPEPQKEPEAQNATVA